MAKKSNPNITPQTDKKFGISSWAINNSVTVYVIMAIIFVGGVMAFTSMPREDFPEIIENKIYISSVFPGNPAEDVEKFITEPIEDEIKDIHGIKDVSSVSFNDYGMTIVEFNDDVTTDEAKIEVKDKIDLVKADSDWPVLDTGDKVEPSVFDLNFAEETPIMNINLTGNYTLQQLKDYGEMLQDDIEDLSEIKEVSIRGVNDREVEIALDSYKMAAAQVSFSDVANTIAGDNKTISGGNVINEEQRINIRVVGEISTPEQLENMVVKHQGGSVYLRDIAEVKFREQDKTTYARNFAKEVVMLDVKKRSGENLIIASEKINEVLAKAKENYLPNDLEMSITNDSSPKTDNQVKDLINNIIFGVLLVVGVLMFFLGIRNASFVGLAIPLSMLMSLMILDMMGVTMNTMVLFGLVMGLGMLVDNGIVVVENVFTLVNEGYSKKDAAKQGVGEIAWPIIASTATTLAAFFPLGLWPGMMGKFMVYFPMTLSVVLGSSLFVALVINAMLTAEFMHSEEEDKSAPSTKKIARNSIILLVLGVMFLVLGFITNAGVLRIFGNLGIFFAVMLWAYEYALYPASIWFQNKLLPWLEDKYQNFLAWILKGRTPGLMMIGMIALFIFSIMLIGIAQPKVLFFPENEPNQIIVYIEYPEGTDIEKTNRLTKEVEQEVIEVLKEYTVDEDGKPYNFMAEAIVSQVGEGASNPYTDTGSQAEIPHKGKITVSLREFKYRRGIKSSDVLHQVREAVKGHSGASIIVEKDPAGPPSGYPVNIEIAGDDYYEMMDQAERMVAFINESGVAGLEEVKIDVSRDNPELQLRVDRELAGGLGINNQSLGMTLRQSIYGLEVSRYRPADDDDDYPINIRLNEAQRYDENVLFNQPVTFRNAANGQIVQVPISAIIDQKKTKQFSKIKREDYKRTITVYSNVLTEQGYNSNEIVEKLKTKLTSGFIMPEGMSFKFTGEQEEQAENMGFLLKALLIGVAAIALIIVAQFNSVSKPVIIMLSVLLSFIGVFLGLIVSGSSPVQWFANLIGVEISGDFIILMTMMGIISLAGIVVNNAIVLIDYTDLLINRKKKKLELPEKVMLPLHEIKESIISGGRSRLRPVLLTAITTVFGLVPLAIGLNIDFQGLFMDYNPNIYMGGDNVMFWGPLAWTVIYGLVFATFLTLVVVPVLQYLVNRMKFKARYGRKFKKYPEAYKDFLE